MESSKQAKIEKITEAYQQEIAGTEKTLKRVKIIQEELLELTETYQRNVLERTDELEQLGHLEAGRSKEFSKQVLNLSKLVPPIELKASM